MTQLLMLAFVTSLATSKDSMVDKINTERMFYGREALTENPKLDASATNKACDLRDKGYWAHTSPDGIEPWKFFYDAGYTYAYAGENLVKNLDDDTAMTRLMNSQTHKENILSPKFKEVGIGRCGQFIVQHFGRRI